MKFKKSFKAIKSIVLSSFTMISFISFTQTIEVTEKVETYLDAGTHESFYVEIPYANKKSVEKELKSLLKKWKGKVSVKKEIFVDDAEVKSVGSNTFDAYGKVIELSEGKVALAMAIDLGGAFLNSEKHPEKYNQFKTLIQEIAVDCSKDAVENQIKVQEKLIKTKNGVLKSLVSDTKKLEKSIKDYEQKIVDAKKQIKLNKENEVKAKSEIKQEESNLTKIQERLNSIK